MASFPGRECDKIASMRYAEVQKTTQQLCFQSVIKVFMIKKVYNLRQSVLKL